MVCSHVRAANQGNRRLNWRAVAKSAQEHLSQGSKTPHPCFCATCFERLQGPVVRADAIQYQVCSKGHHLVIDCERLEVVCTACKDYVYCQAWDKEVQLAHASMHYVERFITPGEPSNDPASQVRAKRARLASEYGLPCEAGSAGWQPVPGPTWDDDEPKGMTASLSQDGLPLGLRGLNNLGNTCFMNSVLQALVHIPLVRNYFLGEGHTPQTCRRKSGKPCLGCELDALLSSMHSGEREPLSPVAFLYSWWSMAPDTLAEYQQQDAHEFYLSALSGLSAAVISAPPPFPSAYEQATALGAPACVFGRPTSCISAISGLSAMASEDGEPSVNLRRVPELNRAAPGADLGTGAVDGVGSKPGLQQGCSAAAGSAPAGGVGSALNSLPDGGTRTNGTCDHTTHNTADSLSKDQVPNTDLDFVDTVFGGLLRSDVTCSVCGHTSTAYDPFLDISLDLVAVTKAASKQHLNSGQGRGRGETPPVAGGGGAGGSRGGHPRGGSHPPPFLSRQRSGSLPPLGALPSLSQGTDAISGIDHSTVVHGAGNRGRGRPRKRQLRGASCGHAAQSESGSMDMAHEGQEGESCMQPMQPGQDSMKHDAAEMSDDNNMLYRGLGEGFKEERFVVTRQCKQGGLPTASLPHQRLVGNAGDGKGVQPDHGTGPAGPELSLGAAESHFQGGGGGKGGLGTGGGSRGAADDLQDCMSSPPSSSGLPILQQQPNAQVVGQGRLLGRGPGAVGPTQGGRGAALMARAQEISLSMGLGSTFGSPSPLSPTTTLTLPVLSGVAGAPTPVLARSMPLPPAPGAGAQGSEAVHAQGLGTAGGAGAAGAPPPAAAMSRPSSPALPPALAVGAADLSGAAPASPYALPGVSISTGTGHLVGNKKGKKGGPSKAPGFNKAPPRCGLCYTCKNKALKKGCERNKALREGRPYPDLGVLTLPPDSISTVPPPLSLEANTVAAEIQQQQQGSLGVEGAGGMGESQGPWLPSVKTVVEPPSPHLQMKTEAWPAPQGQGRQGRFPSASFAAGAGRAAAALPPLQPPQPPQPAPFVPTFPLAFAPPPITKDGVTLAACLRHFVQPEALAPSEAWVCSNCKRRQPAVKQMSLRRAPPVLCMHVKRFEHCPGSNRILKKLQAPLAFPTGALDLHPYLTATILKQRYLLRGAAGEVTPQLGAAEAGTCEGIKPEDCQQGMTQSAHAGAGAGAEGGRRLPPPRAKAGAGRGGTGATKAATKAEPASNAASLGAMKTEASFGLCGADASFQPAPGGMAAAATQGATGEIPGSHSLPYILYAVICHKGDITGGHYVVYVRCAGHWFLCDDAWVTLVEEEEVAGCQAYMLFYCNAQFYQDRGVGMPIGNSAGM